MGYQVRWAERDAEWEDITDSKAFDWLSNAYKDPRSVIDEMKNKENPLVARIMFGRIRYVD